MRIVYTSGTFDLFHIGHLNIIQRSRALGDYLIVGVSTDALVESYKVKPPIICFEDRAEIVRNLRCVDRVVAQEKLFDKGVMMNMGVNIMTIGSDWQSKGHPTLQEIIDDGEIRVVFLPYTESVSTSRIKREISQGWSDDRR